MKTFLEKIMQNIYVDSSDLTILLGKKFYLIDKTAYNYEEGTLYTPGYYVIYGNELYKVQTKTSKSPAEEPSAYLKQSSIDDVTTVASSDDIQELKNEIQGSGDETEKDFTELRDSIQELDTNLQELDTEVTQELSTIKEQYLKIDDFSTTLQGSSIDASQIKGILNLSNIPASALPVVKIVTGVEDMYTLTTNDVQVGDVVKVQDGSRLFYVVDTSNLNSPSGYTEFSEAVDWSTILGIPETFTPSPHTHSLSDITDSNTLATKSEVQEVKNTLNTKLDTDTYTQDQSTVVKYTVGDTKSIDLQGTDKITWNSLDLITVTDKVQVGNPELPLVLQSKEAVLVNDTPVCTLLDLTSYTKNTDFESYKATVSSDLSQINTSIEGLVSSDAFNTYKDEIQVSINSINTALDGKLEAQALEPYALKSDITDLVTQEELDNLNSILSNKADKSEIPDVSEFAKDSDLKYIADTVIPEMNTNTANALDLKVQWNAEKNVISLPQDGSISALRNPETLEGGNLLAQRTYDSGVTYITEVGTTKNNLTLNSTERPQVDLKSSSEKLAYFSDTPQCIRINLRDKKLTSEVHDKSEILGWFDCTEESELKQKIVKEVPMFVMYGIQLSGNPYFYKFPVEYIAFESKTQLKMVFTGLDTSNDVPSKYTFLFNLDGTVIDNNSNISMTLEPLDTTVDLSSKLDVAVYEADKSNLGILNLGNFETSSEAETQAKEVTDTKVNFITYTVQGSDNGVIINNFNADTNTQFLFLKGKKYKRTISAGTATQWVSDDAKFLPGKAINGRTFFKLTTDSTPDEIKAAMSAGSSLITEDDLNQCITNGYWIKEYSMYSTILVGFNGSAFTFMYLGYPNPIQGIVLRTITIRVQGDTYQVQQDGTSGEVLTSSSSIVQTLQTEVQELKTKIEELTQRIVALES